MNRLPVLISVPHAGHRVPAEVEAQCQLTRVQILEDGDGGAAEVYYRLEEHVAGFVTTDLARAVVDMNRAPGDFRKDGVIKTHTCWDVEIWDPPLSERSSRQLVERYHAPYHARIDALLQTSGARLAVDCHTMAAHGPPVGPDSGKERPLICLSNADGTCPGDLLDAFAQCLEQAFGVKPSINHPFGGGFIIRSHSGSVPWVQLELSRSPEISNDQKGSRVLNALKSWVGASVTTEP